MFWKAQILEEGTSEVGDTHWESKTYIYKNAAMGSMEIMIFLALQLLSCSICSLTKIVSSPDSGSATDQKETPPESKIRNRLIVG